MSYFVSRTDAYWQCPGLVDRGLPVRACSAPLWLRLILSGARLREDGPPIRVARNQPIALIAGLNLRRFSAQRWSAR
jgi:hypothetical protein